MDNTSLPPVGAPPPDTYAPSLVQKQQQVQQPQEQPTTSAPQQSTGAPPDQAPPNSTPPNFNQDQDENLNKDNVEQASKDVTPEMKHKMESYTAALMHVLHNPQTSQQVLDMLSSGDATQALPKTAYYVSKLVEGSFEKKTGQPVPDEIKLQGAMYLSGDLAELGNAAKIWDKPITKEMFPSVFQAVVQEYIHKGLADGSIDPVELQAETEPLLNDKQKQIGNAIMKQLNLPEKPTVSMGVDKYVQTKTAPLQAENDRLKSLVQAQGQVVQGGQNNG